MIRSSGSSLRRATAGVTAGLLALSGTALLAAAPAAAVEGFAFERLAGADRFGTAAAIAADTYSTAPEVLLANGLDFPDALAGNYLAGLADGPVLLTTPDDVPEATLQALRDLEVEAITILGGTNAVSQRVEDRLTALGYEVDRVAGTDRYKTAAAVARVGGPTAVGTTPDNGPTAILATGQQFADALASGPLAFDAALPVLLTEPATLREEAASALDDLGIEHVLIAGGTDALSPAVVTAVEARGITTERLAGTNRAETAVAVADFARDELGFHDTHVQLARGDDFADALTGGSHAGAERSPILLTVNPTTSAPSTIAALRASCDTLGDGHVYGGTEAVSLAVEAEATAAASCQPPAGVISLFPTDELTVLDADQLTGRRVALPTADCGPVVTCGLVERLNRLDGFDLDPRLAVTFELAVDPTEIAADVVVEQVGGGQTTGVDRVVYDDATNTLYAHPAEQLAPGTTYRLRVAGRDDPEEQTTFTTHSATDGLLDLRAQVDARLPSELEVDAVVPAAGTTVEYLQDTGAATLNPVSVPSAITSGSLVFGSYLAPSWLRADRTIEQTPTEGTGPAPVGAERLPFLLVLPAGTPPAGGWPVAIFGHGFTRTAGDVLLAAAVNTSSGVATIATHVAGHGYGPDSQWRVTTGGVAQTLPAYGRGVDVDGTAGIGAADGSSPTPGTAAAAVGSSDVLRQTAADNMTLLRALGDPGDALELEGDGVDYFGQSFGGIYGTMLAGADPDVDRAALNVPGGPVTEIVRLSPSFRPLLQQQLFFAGLLNGGTNRGFTESMPLRGEAPVLAPVAGALPIQEFIARTTWLNRSGSPETFSPLLVDERVLYQVARGDRTVPNPTSYTLLDAGDLFPRTSLYRNDLTPQAGSNPHGFLLDFATFPTAAGQGQTQITTFLLTGATIDPDGTGPVWEVPVTDPTILLTLGFSG